MHSLNISFARSWAELCRQKVSSLDAMASVLRLGPTPNKTQGPSHTSLLSLSYLASSLLSMQEMLPALTKM